MVIAVAFVLLPTGSRQRQEPRILSSSDTAPSPGFVIHPADTPAPGTPPASATPPGNPADLDAVMQRLRAAGAKPDATDTQAQTTTPSSPASPAQPGSAPPADPTTTPPPAATPPSPPRWGSVTGQGTRWRMARSGSGYTVSIDLGSGQVADVHVLPAFGNLDPASVNLRVDYLRDTILKNFSHQSGTYSFARDGSVSVEQ